MWCFIFTNLSMLFWWGGLVDHVCVQLFFLLTAAPKLPQEIEEFRLKAYRHQKIRSQDRGEAVNDRDSDHERERERVRPVIDCFATILIPAQNFWRRRIVYYWRRRWWKQCWLQTVLHQRRTWRWRRRTRLLFYIFYLFRFEPCRTHKHKTLR